MTYRFEAIIRTASGYSDVADVAESVNVFKRTLVANLGAQAIRVWRCSDRLGVCWEEPRAGELEQVEGAWWRVPRLFPHKVEGR